MRERIGFMQGRLVDQVDGKIQAFPATQWREEFPAAQGLGLRWMEWTLDAEGLAENPLCTDAGRDEIRRLERAHEVTVASLTGDCFMQRPFWKATGNEARARLQALDQVLESAASLGVGQIVVPLVDQGSLESPQQERALLDALFERTDFMRAAGLSIAFESDLAPQALARFIESFPADAYGINYDIGNSASLGYDPAEELTAYGHRVINVHMKDRLLGGSTVPLGAGSAQFDAVFRYLSQCHYGGRVILQTARAQDGNHASTLERYVNFTAALMERHFGS